MSRSCILVLLTALSLEACAEEEDPFYYDKLAKGGAPESVRPKPETNTWSPEPRAAPEGGTSGIPSAPPRSQPMGGSGGADQGATAIALGGSLSIPVQSTRMPLGVGGTLASMGGANGREQVSFQLPDPSSAASAPLTSWSTVAPSTSEEGGSDEAEADPAESPSACMGPEHCRSDEYCDTSSVLAEYQGMVVGVCAKR